MNVDFLIKLFDDRLPQQIVKWLFFLFGNIMKKTDILNNLIKDFKGNKHLYQYKPQTNLNGVINSVYYMLTENYLDKERSITIEQIKAYCRERKFIDTHIKITNELLKSNCAYWSNIVSKAMVLNKVYLFDILYHFEAKILNYVTIDVDITSEVQKLFNINIKEPEFNVNNSTEVFEVTNWLKDENSKVDTRFNLIDAIVCDELEEFQPQVYGGRKMYSYDNVCNKALTSMVVTDDMYSAIEFLWNDNSKECRKLLREVMEPYFTKENIDNFIKSLSNINTQSTNFSTERYNININKYIHEKDKYIYNIKYYTNVWKMDERVELFNKLVNYVTDKAYYMSYIKEYINTLYRCIPHVKEKEHRVFNIVNVENETNDKEFFNMLSDTSIIEHKGTSGRVNDVNNINIPVNKEMSPGVIKKQNNVYAELERKRKEMSIAFDEIEEEVNPYSEYSEKWYRWEIEHNRM